MCYVLKRSSTGDDVLCILFQVSVVNVADSSNFLRNSPADLSRHLVVFRFQVLFSRFLQIQSKRITIITSKHFVIAPEK